ERIDRKQLRTSPILEPVHPFEEGVLRLRRQAEKIGHLANDLLAQACKEPASIDATRSQEQLAMQPTLRCGEGDERGLEPILVEQAEVDEDLPEVSDWLARAHFRDGSLLDVDRVLDDFVVFDVAKDERASQRTIDDVDDQLGEGSLR